MAYARLKGKITHLGYFHSFIDAVYARHEFCLANWGEFYSGMEVDVERHRLYLRELFGDCGEPSVPGTSYCCCECREDAEKIARAKVFNRH